MVSCSACGRDGVVYDAGGKETVSSIWMFEGQRTDRMFA